MLGVSASSHTRASKRKTRLVSAPTGQMSMVFPCHLLRQRAAWESVNAGIRSPAKEIQFMVIGPLVQEADAAPAEHAALLVQHDQFAQWVALVLVALFLT